MKIFNQLGIILAIWTVGELISSLFSSIITIPGTIMGMIILFLLLQFKILKEDAIKDVTDFLLNNMAIFFVPAGVSLINSFGLMILGLTTTARPSSYPIFSTRVLSSLSFISSDIFVYDNRHPNTASAV